MRFGRAAGKLAEIADEVGLVRVAARRGCRGASLRRRARLERSERLLKARDPREALR
jgi:hypothetical protein